MRLFADFRNHLLPPRLSMATPHMAIGDLQRSPENTVAVQRPYLIAGALLVGLGVLGALPHHTALQSELAQVRQQAQAGEPKAELELALAYRDGRFGLNSDHAAAAHWLGQAAAAGNAYAAALLGDAYSAGDGVTADRGLAIHWWRRAAQAGNAHGESALGAALAAAERAKGEDGDAMLSRQDEGRRWLEQAALQGDDLAQRQLGVEHPAAAGEGMAAVAPRLTEMADVLIPEGGSVDALREKALAGDSSAAYQLAMRYRDGAWGVEADNRQALDWLELAANHGNALAMSTLASAFEQGSLGLDPNPSLADSWRRRAQHSGAH